jgi:hypothetical protein
MPTYYTAVYLGNDRKHATPQVTATDRNIIGLTAKNENAEHKLYIDNSSPELLDDLHTETMWDCWIKQKRNAEECWTENETEAG